MLIAGFETAQDGILLLDGMTGKITDANQCLLKLLGCTRVELLGKRLWELDHLRNDFLSTVFHEISAPLTTLKMGIENLEVSRAGKFGKGENELIEVLKRSMERLGRLINDLNTELGESLRK